MNYFALSFRLFYALTIFSCLSLLPQIAGLAGENGILAHLKTINPQFRPGLLTGWAAGFYFVLLVTTVFSLMLIIKQELWWLAFLSWFGWWLIISSAGNFAIYIWDVLLSEVLFLGFLYSLAIRFPRLQIEGLVGFLLEWLLFRLHFSMGMVKFWQGAEHWRDLTAMQFFYPNQPMPAWPGWWLYHAPQWFHELSVAYVFLAEIIAPFFIFGNTFFRRAAFAVMVPLQIIIFVSGNYGVFNLATISLCFILLDNKRGDFYSAFYQKLFSFVSERKLSVRNCFVKIEKILPQVSFQRIRVTPLLLGRALLSLIFLLLFTPSIFYLYKVCEKKPSGGYIHETNYVFLPIAEKNISPVMLPLLRFVSYYYIVNPYALFGNIPTYRLQIIPQYSEDGIQWNDIPLKIYGHKENEPPRWIAPMMWRLDHAFYYESFRIRDPLLHQRLSYFLGLNWMPGLLKGLLTGSEDILKLFAWSEKPVTRYIRFQYNFLSFCNLEEHQKTGCYWKSEAAHPGRFPQGIYNLDNYLLYR